MPQRNWNKKRTLLFLGGIFGLGLSISIYGLKIMFSIIFCIFIGILSTHMIYIYVFVFLGFLIILVNSFLTGINRSVSERDISIYGICVRKRKIIAIVITTIFISFFLIILFNKIKVNNFLNIFLVYGVISTLILPFFLYFFYISLDIIFIFIRSVKFIYCALIDWLFPLQK